jgi:hypothetical protein
VRHHCFQATNSINSKLSHWPFHNISIYLLIIDARSTIATWNSLSGLITKNIALLYKEHYYRYETTSSDRVIVGAVQLSFVPPVLLSGDRSHIGTAATFTAFHCFCFQELHGHFYPGFVLHAHWLAGLPVFLLQRISSFLVLRFFPPICVPELNSVTQSTLQILHQKGGTAFGLGHCRICDGDRGTLTFFFVGYQFCGCLCSSTTETRLLRRYSWVKG